MSPAEALQLDDKEFEAVFRSVSAQEIDALVEPQRGLWFDRVKGATPHVNASVKRAARAQAKFSAMASAIAGGYGTSEGEYLRTVNLIHGSDVVPEQIHWLWKYWLAAGKVHISAGAPGTGKTTIALSLAGTVTRGGTWPDGSKAEVGSVVIWSGEDDPADTLIPRLMLAGADLSKIHFVGSVTEGNEKRSFDPARDMEALQRKLAEIPDVRLLIVDPVVSAISGDSHKNAEVRRGLQPLADLGASMGCAVFGITHFSKGTGGRDPVERLNGSLAFGAVARIVLVAAKHQEESEEGRAPRLFLRAKSNIGPDDGGFEYDIVQAPLEDYPNIQASVVMWGKSVQGSARDLLATAEAVGEDGDETSKTEAQSWLEETLTKGTAVAGKELKESARRSGISERTLYRAAQILGVKTTSGGFGKSRFWHMCANSLMCAMCANEIRRENLGTDGTNGETDPMPAKSAKKFTSVLDGTHGTHGEFGTHGETSRADENEGGDELSGDMVEF